MPRGIADLIEGQREHRLVVRLNGGGDVLNVSGQFYARRQRYRPTHHHGRDYNRFEGLFGLRRGRIDRGCQPDLQRGSFGNFGSRKQTGRGDQRQIDIALTSTSYNATAVCRESREYLRPGPQSGLPSSPVEREAAPGLPADGPRRRVRPAVYGIARKAGRSCPTRAASCAWRS